MKAILKRKVFKGLYRPPLWGLGGNLAEEPEELTKLQPIIEKQEQIIEMPDAKLMNEDELPDEIKIIKDWHKKEQ